MQERRLAPRGVTAALLCAVAARCDINAVGAVLEAGASPLRRPPPRALGLGRALTTLPAAPWVVELLFTKIRKCWLRRHCVNKNENARKAHFYKSLLWAIDATPRPKCFHRSDFRMLGPRERTRRPRPALRPRVRLYPNVCVQTPYSARDVHLVRFMLYTDII